MYRKAIEQLKTWRNKPNRMPLLIVGARQVGKTWLMKQFGTECFENIAYLSFDSSPALQQTLENTVSPKELIPVIAAETGVPVVAEKTLIVFDEVQDSPRALLSLKYFQEDAPEFHIVAAGSALGVMLHSRAVFPVGKVEFLDLYPMSFDEYLLAIGEEPLTDFVSDTPLVGLSPFHEKLLRLVREYIFVGGMPAAVAANVANRGNLSAVREMQDIILRAYDRDFSKYATPLFASKLREVWQSLPSQLAQENRRFTYAQIRKSARGRDYAAAIQWLKDSSMATPVRSVTQPRHPLASYADEAIFKMFIHDIGLLSALSDLNPKATAGGKDVFLEFKGALAEQFVFQELTCTSKQSLFYWSNETSTASIDFLAQNASGLPIPIEVKSGINLRARSLGAYRKKFSPAYSIRISVSNYKYDMSNRIYDVPIYAVSRIGELLE
jgi:predicted AAA+ superfamily ATPase